MITFDLKPKEVEKKLEMSLDELIKSKKTAPKASGKAPKAIGKAKAGATGIAAKKQAIKGRRAAATQAPKTLSKKGKGSNAPKSLVAKGGRVTKLAPKSQPVRVKGKVGSVMANKLLNKARANKQKGSGAPKVLGAAVAKGGARKGAGSAPKTLLVKKQGPKGAPKYTVVQKKGQVRAQGQRSRGGKGGNVNAPQRQPQRQQMARGLNRVARGGIRKQRAPIKMGGGMGMMGMPAPIFMPHQAAGAGMGLGGSQAPYAMQQMQQQIIAKQAEYIGQFQQWSKGMMNYVKGAVGANRGGRGGGRGGGGGGEGNRGRGKGRGGRR